MKKILLSVALSTFLLNAANVEIIQAPNADKRVSPALENTILSFHDSVKNAKNSVVNISTTSTRNVNQHNPFGNMFNDPFFREFFGESPFGNTGPQKRKTSSLGSGVIISKDGYIITNAHVVNGADEIVVTLLNSDKEYDAKVVGIDSKTDLAVIKIDEKNLQAISFANSDSLLEGDIVFAIGNPFGMGGTITQGIISALNKSGVGLNQYENFIQTDASINPGNSGGALIDSRGFLIGINSAILSRSGDNNGIGFAIPSNMAKKIAQSLIKDGKIERGFLGVSISDLTKETKEVYKNKEGALVMGVEEKGAADRAGLKMGDLIIKINNKNIKNSNELKNMIGEMSPNDNVEIAYERSGKINTTKFKLDKMSGDEVTTAGDTKSDIIQGLTLENITDTTKLNLPKNTKGVLVTKVNENSVGEKSGFRAGDVIIQVGSNAISNIDELKETIKKMGKGKKSVFVLRNGRAIVVVIP